MWVVHSKLQKASQNSSNLIYEILLCNKVFQFVSITTMQITIMNSSIKNDNKKSLQFH